MMTQGDDLKVTIKYLWREHKMSNHDIAKFVNRTPQLVRRTTKHLENNGTRCRAIKNLPKPPSVEEITGVKFDDWATQLKGRRYEDVKLTPSNVIPINGPALKFAAHVRNLSYGVSEMA